VLCRVTTHSLFSSLARSYDDDDDDEQRESEDLCCATWIFFRKNMNIVDYILKIIF
jgi:hypothetical protein